MEESAKPASEANSSFRILLRDSTVYAFGRIALSALDLLLLPVYTRVMAPDEFGAISLAAAFMAVIALLSPLGMDAALGRFYFDQREDEREHRITVGTLFLSIAVLALLVAIVASVVVPGLGGGLLEGLSPKLILILIWTGFCGVFSTLWLQMLQLRRQPRAYVAFALAQAIVRGGLTLVFVWALDRGAMGWAEAYLITNVVAGVLAVVLMRREFLLVVKPDVVREAIKYALPVVLHQLAGWITMYASRFILNHVATLRAVGVYQVGFGIGQVLSLIVTSFNFAYAPRFMAAATSNSEKALNEFGEMATYYLAGVVGVALAVSVFAQEIVSIAASNAYVEAAPLVPVIAAAFVLQGAYYLHVNAVFFSKVLTRVLPVVTVAGATVNVVATLALVPRFGIIGAAWAGLVTNVVVLLGAYLIGRRSIRIRFDARRIWLFSAAAVLLVVLSQWLSSFLPSLLQRAVVKAGALSVYLAVLWSLGIIDPARLARLVRGDRKPPEEPADRRADS